MRLVTLLALSTAALVACTSPETSGDAAEPAADTVDTVGVVDLDAERAAVDRVLSDFHRLASEADFDAYFALMAPDAVFIGTDATERWSVEEFRSFAEPTSGWTYDMTERHVFVAADGQTAWFDERLDNARYGDTRGTGVLVKTADGWKIAQYHLTIPMPNALAGEFVDRIRAEAGGG